MAALHAARGGRRVCLLERKPVAGIPVRCGEGIGLRGLHASIDLDERWVLTRIRSACFVSPGGRRVALSDIGENFVLDRIKLESDLVARAVAAGVDYHTSSPVLSVERRGVQDYLCRTPSAGFLARCVVLADGVESRLARGMGWETALQLDDIESCAFCRCAHESIDGDTIHIFVGSTYAPGGYAWVFPRHKGVANVGLGVRGSLSEGGTARLYLERFVSRFFKRAQVSDIHCGGVPSGRWLKPLVRDGVMIVGDAARQVNSLNGAGLSYSLYAGKIAGIAAAQATGGGQCSFNRLKAYEKQWASFMGRQQLRSYRLKNMLMKMENDSFFDSIASKLEGTDPGKLNYLKVFMRVFSRHPLLLIDVLRLFR
jgi:digeranylgeranylglycerophospholipid reductase